MPADTSSGFIFSDQNLSDIPAVELFNPSGITTLEAACAVIVTLGTF